MVGHSEPFEKSSETCIKDLFLSSLLIPFAGPGGHNGGAGSFPNNLVEVRTGTWPITLESSRENSRTSYFLEFRDQQVARGVVMDTLPFPNLEQLKYFGKALSALKGGTNGDIAQFKDYSLTRADKKLEGGVWFVLKYQWGSTDFQKPEADIMINTIKGL